MKNAMKKIVTIIAVAMSGICIWWQELTLKDVLDAIWYCIYIVKAIWSAFMDYIMPRPEGVKSYVVSGYLGARSFLGNIFGWQPLNVYDHIFNRAKANPLEAIGAIAVIVTIAWLITFKYRMLYRFYHWILVTRRKR